ncbi:MAG: alpha/beta fold hydrolase [Alphaproteobacteria bacterium]
MAEKNRLQAVKCCAGGGNKSTAVLLHGSGGSGAMWRDLAVCLRRCFRVVTPDLLGYGKAVDPPEPGAFRLETEVAAIEPLLPADGNPIHLIGYSYGGAVALNMALAKPRNVASLTLIEPVAFGLLHVEGSEDALAEIEAVSSAYNETRQGGDVEIAVGRFVDYWSGRGTWLSLSAALRADTLRRADKIALDYEATLGDPARPADCARLAMPALVMAGGKGPRPTRRIAELLSDALPDSRHQVIAQAGHMLPFTHAAELADKIGAFLCMDGASSMH